MTKYNVEIRRMLEEDFTINMTEILTVAPNQTANISVPNPTITASPSLALNPSATIVFDPFALAASPTATIMSALYDYDVVTDGDMSIYINPSQYEYFGTDYLFAGWYQPWHWDNGWTYKTYILFDVAGTPPLQGETIIYASLDVYGIDNSGFSTANVRIACDYLGDPSIPTDWNDVNSRTLTSNYTSVSLHTVSVGDKFTIDITTAVQELVNKSDWGENYLGVMIWNDFGNESRINLASSRNGSYDHPKLHLTF
jgi:hypothetical protein